MPTFFDGVRKGTDVEPHRAGTGDAEVLEDDAEVFVMESGVLLSAMLASLPPLKSANGFEDRWKDRGRGGTDEVGDQVEIVFVRLAALDVGKVRRSPGELVGHFRKRGLSLVHVDPALLALLPVPSVPDASTIVVVVVVVGFLFEPGVVRGSGG